MTTIDVDLRFTEESSSESEEEGEYVIRAGTYEVTEERKYKESVTANASVSATIEPVPLPVDLSPTESYREGTDSEPDGGGNGNEDGGGSDGQGRLPDRLSEPTRRGGSASPTRR